MSIAAIRMSRNEKANHPKVWEALSSQYPCLEMADDSGDFHIVTDDGELLVIERKSPNDLLGSIKSGRLFSQAAKYKAITKWVYFIVTGTISHSNNGKAVLYRPGSGWHETGWDHAAIQGAMLSLQELGCYIIHCAGEGDFVPCMVRLANRSRDAIPVTPAREAIVLGPFNETPAGIVMTEQQRIGAGILTAFSGIGPNKAIQIMEHFPNAITALHFLTDLEDNETKIVGTGEGIKRSIFNQLGGTVLVRAYPNGGDNNET